MRRLFTITLAAFAVAGAVCTTAGCSITVKQPGKTADSSTSSKSSVTAKDGHISMPRPVLFETGKANILPESESILEDLRSFLEQNPQIKLVRIEGHTDNVGKPDNNLTLSGNRAKSVKTWLVNKGIASSRLVAVGFGDTKPIATNDSAQGREKNRRTDYVIVESGNPRDVDKTGGGTLFE